MRKQSPLVRRHLRAAHQLVVPLAHQPAVRQALREELAVALRVLARQAVVLRVLAQQRVRQGLLELLRVQCPLLVQPSLGPVLLVLLAQLLWRPQLSTK